MAAGVGAAVEGEVRKFRREDGDVAVLISDGHGAGFSTWCHDVSKIAWDARLTEFFWMENPTKEEFKTRLEDCGYENVCLLGFEGLDIVWVPAGRPFRVVEYDGAESIEYLNMSKWTTF